MYTDNEVLQTVGGVVMCSWGHAVWGHGRELHGARGNSLCLSLLQNHCLSHHLVHEVSHRYSNLHVNEGIGVKYGT